jgi:hypothetical protein
VTYLAEYRNDGTVAAKELRKGVSAVTVQQVASQNDPVFRKQPVWKFLSSRFVVALLGGSSIAA